MDECDRNVNIFVDQKISRGEQPDTDHDIDLAEVEKVTVYDENGCDVLFGDLFFNQKTIVILIRHFLCYMTKEYVDDLGLIPEGYLKAAGVRLVVLGCGPHKFINDFKHVTGYKYEMYCDPDRHVYKHLNCLQTMKRGRRSVSQHIKSNTFLGVIKSAWRGMKYREYQGNIDQQGGAFILGPGRQLHFAHQDWSPSDHAPINTLLEAAGVQRVPFHQPHILHL